MVLTCFHDNVLTPSLPGMRSRPPLLELTTARESVSQNKYVPFSLSTDASVIASNKCPAEVIRLARGGKNHFPCFSIKLEPSENTFSPEKTLTGTALFLISGISSTKKP